MLFTTTETQPLVNGYSLSTLESTKSNLKRLSIMTGIPRNTLRYRLRVMKLPMEKALVSQPKGGYYRCQKENQ